MYQSAEICFPRKKRVPESFHSNTYRIFDENLPQRLDSYQAYKDHIFPSRSADEINLLKTYNNPHPQNVKFIRTNVRWLNAPISHIETKDTEADQAQWWPDRSGEVVTPVTPTAPYSRDSVQRRDFLPPPRRSTPCTRAGCNPLTTPAASIVPALAPVGPRKILEERMSFLHQYDSRRLRDQPHQGRVRRTGQAARSVCVERGFSADLRGALSAPAPPPQILREGPPSKHASSNQASAPKRRARIRSLDTCSPALPPLRHGGRNSLP
ncbi:hypothetical protein COCON_G00039870 [Conger conger]|uniref:Uncharacterized protein n=1 Tax=Conger conger TaxID=82655 RepID=A0A9Q1E0D9_CONCO|nr:hypothetical protein COCON_G00039870 [Conger conger]